MWAIPLIGPLSQMISGIFGKWQDTKLGMYKTDGTVDVEGMKASENIIASTRDDIGVRLARDLMLFPVCAWTSLISWDTIVAIRYPGLMFHVAPYPPALEYLPYAAVTFLLGAVGMTIWSRK